MEDDLNTLRKQIDAVDGQLLNTLAERVRLVKTIGKLKKSKGIPPMDLKRWQQVLLSKIKKAKSLNLSEKFIEKLYNLIHEYSLEIENKI